MNLRRELLAAIGALVLSNLLLAFGAISLLTRMSPAIERILKDNVYSMTAAEEILSECAHAGGSPLAEDAQARVLLAFHDAERNVTEAAERPVLARLGHDLRAAMSGDMAARRRAVTSARELTAINRQAMNAADAHARRLGRAGAWAAVFLGFSSLLLSLLLVVRIRRRLVEPVLELHDVLEATHRGDRLRRCRRRDAPQELVQVAYSINRLLDERLARAGSSATPGV